MSTEAAVNGHEAAQVFAEGAAPVEHKEEGVKVSNRSLSIRGVRGVGLGRVRRPKRSMAMSRTPAQLCDPTSLACTR